MKYIILMVVRWQLAYRDKIETRQIKYLNNIVEQDHRFIKRITRSMVEFNAFHSVHAALIGIEIHHMLHKNQHNDAANIYVFEQFYSLVP